MKMNRNVAIGLWLLTATPVLAQPTAWTLDSCIAYASSHALDVKKSVVAISSAKAELGSALGALLPTIDGGVSGQFSWGRNIDPETNTYNTINTFNSNYSIEASVTLFDGGRTLNRFRQARMALSRSRNALQQTRDERAIDVMGKFVDAVYYKESIQLAEEKLAESRRLLEKTRRMFELGMKARPDVAQLVSQVAGDEYTLTQQRNLFTTSLLALKSSMNYPLADTLTLAAFCEEKPIVMQEEANAIYNYAAANSPRALEAEFALKDARYDYRIQKGYLAPTISLGGQVATNYYTVLGAGVTSTSFGSQFHNNMGEYVYASVSIPIFDFSTYKNIKKARHQVETAQLERDETLRQLHDDIAQAVADRDGYAMETLSLERKVESDSTAYVLSCRKYEEGMLSTFDLHTAANTLLESRVTLLQKQLLLVIKQRLVDYYKGKQF